MVCALAELSVYELLTPLFAPTDVSNIDVYLLSMCANASVNVELADATFVPSLALNTNVKLPACAVLVLGVMSTDLCLSQFLEPPSQCFQTCR